MSILFWISVCALSLTAGWIGGVQGSFRESAIVGQQEGTVILQDQSRSTKPIESPVSEVLVSVGPSMFELYEWSGQPTKTISVDWLPTSQQFLGYALAVTADGWFVTTVSTHSNKLYTLFSPNSEAFSVNQIVQDQSQALSFLHVNGSNIKPIQFSKQFESQSASEAYIIRDRNSLDRIVVGQPEYKRPEAHSDYIHFTHTIDKLINPSLQSQTLCEPVVRDRNEVIGCTTSSGILPFRNLQPLVNNILKKGELLRPKMALAYLDLSTLPVGQDHKDIRSNGALILTKQVIPQQNTGGRGPIVLNAGDVIAYVNDEQVDQNRNVSELIGQYEIGDRLELTVRTGTKEKKVSFILY